MDRVFPFLLWTKREAGEHAPVPPKNPSRVLNCPELDENIPILPENPNRNSISVGTQEQLSQANN